MVGRGEGGDRDGGAHKLNTARLGRVGNLKDCGSAHARMRRSEATGAVDAAATCGPIDAQVCRVPGDRGG